MAMLKKAKIKIDGMSCQHCVKTVTDVMMGIDGVSQVKVNLKKGEARLKFERDLLDLELLETAIVTAGFEFVSLK
ncbi:copper-binding protein [Candidatus Poribacteria bacterium]|jgi:copper ion binding protein|nr:copper-binding protein [Candidatus Poribacteria bacterium]MBD70558.1 copper-binding protein [Candidatus Poribacteria bacterium]|tara:strand:+ start:7140 stop:7364 length:225 start_codon:yes stop_codon:yes gene_type:complete